MNRKIAAFAVIGLCQFGIVHAADLPDVSPDPVAPVVYDWTGLYGGLHLGGAWGDQSWDRIAGAGGGGGGPAANIASLDPSGFLGGLHVGYNVQNDNIVYGIEGDFSFLGADDDDRPANNWFETDLNWMASVTGRLGLAQDNVLFYGKAGLAIADFDYRHNSNAAGIISGSETHTGWTAGAGIEWALDEKWTVRAEYTYADFGSDSVSLSSPAGTGLFKIDNDVSLFRIGVSHRF